MTEVCQNGKILVLGEKKWKRGKQNPELLEFGDRFEETKRKTLHPCTRSGRNSRDLIEAGFSVERDILRSKISQESRFGK